MSPKQELIDTLAGMRSVLTLAVSPSLKVAQIDGLLTHAEGLAQRVGEMSKPRKKESA